MSKEKSQQPKPSYEELIAENERLRRRVDKLERQVERPLCEVAM